MPTMAQKLGSRAELCQDVKDELVPALGMESENTRSRSQIRDAGTDEFWTVK